jgi:hypothetical protein
MKIKRISTIVLLSFVAVSLIVFAVKRITSVDAKPNAQSSNGETQGQGPDRLIVYSFHRTDRCDNCETVEAYAFEAVKSGFAEHLADGRIEWKVVNFEEPENRHFDADFELGNIPSVILLKPGNDARKRWKNLTDVWPLAVAKKKTLFIHYVQDEIRRFMENE